MVEVAFCPSVPYLVKVVHVELNHTNGYLSYEGRVVVVLEETGQHLLGECLLLQNAEALSVGCPAGDLSV